MRAISFFQKRQIPERKRAKREYQKKKNSFKFLILTIVFFTILIVGASFYLIFFSEVLKIKFISFEINDYPLVKIDELLLKNEINKILSKRFYFLTFDNILFFNKKEIEKILSQDKKIENFKVIRIFPRQIKIKISVWQPEAIFCSSNKEYFLLNKNGQPIKNISENEAVLSDLVIIEDKTDKEGRNFPFLFIFDFIKKTNNFDFKINKIEIFKKNGVLEYQAITSENWKIYFNPEENLNEQINNLSLVLREKIINRFKLEYIDLRFGNRVFYK